MVARIVANTRNQGNDVVVVVSAQGDTTDDLITKAAEITSDPSHREMDMLLATGEQDFHLAAWPWRCRKSVFRLSA